MGSRGPVNRADDISRTPRTVTIRTAGPYVPPPKIETHPDGPASSDPFGGGSIASRPADRTLTVHAADGCVPIVLGDEDLPVGGYIIYCKTFGVGSARVMLIDFAVSEGELATDAIANIKWGDKPAADIGATVEIHLGVSGDTTSTLISAYEPTYTTPDDLARVTAKLIWPNQTTGEFDPFDFTCTCHGIKALNLDTLTLEATGNVVQIVREILTNNRYSAGYDPATFFIDAEWLAGQESCDDDMGGGIKRWNIAGRIDQQGTLESWSRQLLAYCNGHMRHNAGKYGLWLDLPRDVALDGDAVPIKFKDFDTDANMYAKATVTHRGLDERPTVVTCTYTDASAAYITGSTQVPKPEDFDPTLDWIEERFEFPFFTTVERCNRMNRYLKKVKEVSVDDFAIAAWQYGALPLEGDRCLLESRRVIPADQTVPNAGATEGVEDLIITDQIIQKLGVMLRGRPYRDAVYDDTVDTTGGPNPPGGTGLTAPDPPTDLDLENDPSFVSDVPHVKIKIDWTPAAEPYSTLTRVTYSRDGGSTFEELGEFPFGPVFLENPQLLQELTFNLYTVRLSTGQISTALTGTIIPTFDDPSVPEVVQIKFGPVLLANQLECYPPHIRMPRSHDHHYSAPTVAAVSGGSLEDGDREVAFSIVYNWGEGQMSDRAAVTTTAPNSRVNVSAIAPGTILADARAYKLYMTNAGDPSGVLIHRNGGLGAVVGGAGSSDSTISADSGYTGNDWEPNQMRGFWGIEVYDAFGIADPTTDPGMPLFTSRRRWEPPTTYKPIDCTPIVHPDGSGGFKIMVYIKVIDTDGGASTGVAFEQDAATPGSGGGVTPDNVIFNQEVDQPGSNFRASEVGGVGMLAMGASILSLSAGDNDDVSIPRTGGYIFSQHTGGTANFNGLVVSPAIDVRVMLLYKNYSLDSSDVVFKQEALTSVADNRFLDADVTVPYGKGALLLWLHDVPGSSRWAVFPFA